MAGRKRLDISSAISRVSPPFLLLIGFASGAVLSAVLYLLLVARPAGHGDASPFASVSHLEEAVRRNVSADLRERCLSIIRGKEGSLDQSFAQAHQDWLLFHNFFRHVRYGEGVYLDIGSNHPFHLSNTFFFDRCLGWRGLCVEPNARYHPLYQQFNRSCTLVPHCVLDRPAEVSMSFGEGVLGRVTQEAQADGAADLPEWAAGQQLQGRQTPEQPSARPQGVGSSSCLPLHSILLAHGLSHVHLASIDIEGAETAALRCFPFRRFRILTWLVETDKAGPHLLRVFLRAGYALVAEVLCPARRLHSDRTRVGVKLDSVFRLLPSAPPASSRLWGAAMGQSRPQGSGGDPGGAGGLLAPLMEFVRGPAFLPGGPKAGQGPQPTCAPWSTGEACVGQSPSIEADEVDPGTMTLWNGTCSLPGLPLSVEPKAYRGR